MKTLTSLAVLAALLFLPPVKGYADDKEITTITLKAEDRDVRWLFETIARAGHAKVVLSPHVRGRVTLKLNRVPWRKAFNELARTQGFDVVEISGTLHVFTRKDKRVGSVINKHGDAEREAVLVERAARAQKDRDAAKAALAAGKRAKRRAVAGAAGRQPIHVRLYDVRDLGDRAFDMARRLLPKAKIESKNGTMVVRSSEAEHAQLHALLRRLRKHTADDKARLTGTLEETARLHFERARKQLEGQERRSRLVAGETLLALREYGVDEDGQTAAAAFVRAKRLEEAAGQLKENGLHEEAQRALAKAAQMRAEAASVRARLVTKRLDGGDLTQSIHALRQDVQALRAQVSELTGLVRQMLGRGAGERRAPGGGTGGRRGR